MRWSDGTTSGKKEGSTNRCGRLNSRSIVGIYAWNTDGLRIHLRDPRHRTMELSVSYPAVVILGANCFCKDITGRLQLPRSAGGGIYRVVASWKPAGRGLTTAQDWCLFSCLQGASRRTVYNGGGGLKLYFPPSAGRIKKKNVYNRRAGTQQTSNRFSFFVPRATL